MNAIICYSFPYIGRQVLFIHIFIRWAKTTGIKNTAISLNYVLIFKNFKENILLLKLITL